MSVLLSNSNNILFDQELKAQAKELVDGLTDRAIFEVTLTLDDGTKETVPEELSRFIRHILEGVSRGPLSVMTLPEKLTTTMAADMLGVSRPTLMKWIKNGEIQAHAVGSHQRLNVSDVLQFRAKLAEQRKQAFESLRAFDEEVENLNR